MKGFETLEKKYGISVAYDGVAFTPSGRTYELYKIYAADECPWENGLTRAGVRRECAEWSEALLSIKAKCGK